MDIVSRLKKYMDYSQLAISQFADTCNIPRPTISQILNGRNKKVSDELIGKIHSAFPDLSIVWLMFGEGPMIINSNIKMSEAQNDNKLTFDDRQISEHELFSHHDDPFPEIPGFYAKKNDTAATAQPDMNIMPGSHGVSQPEREIVEAISNNVEPSKKITSIVVFYADNTFQTFIPS